MFRFTRKVKTVSVPIITFIMICILIVCLFFLGGCQQKDISDKLVMKETIDYVIASSVLSREKDFKEFSVSLKNQISEYLNQKDALRNWIGKYHYMAVFEGEIQGYRPMVLFEIKICKDKGEYLAEISIVDGWKEQSYLAYVEGDSKTIRLIFKETLRGDSAYSRYDEGDILISFSYDEGTLRTTWLEMKGQLPDYIELDKKAEGKYFEKHSL